jgi:hypothetical protein
MSSTDDQDKTSSKMLTFLENHQNPNIKLLYESVYVYSLGYFILKAGIRKNDHLYAWYGEDLLAHLFFTQNHPLYRKLILYMDIDCILMPNFMQAQIDSLVGIKAAGKGCETDDIGENFDFLVEYINNKNGQPLSGAKQFRRDQFFTSGDYLFLLLFSKQSRRNQFSN